jgi:surface protein
MAGMFEGKKNFNEPLNKWNVSKVTNMSSMFSGCIEFNQPLNNWNVSNVNEMDDMFKECKKFNQPLNEWNVSKVTDMIGMFQDCIEFNESLNDWDVRNVTNMAGMFDGCTKFNKSLNRWDVSKVTNMAGMFEGCTKFNNPLNRWDVSKVTIMAGMFKGCTNFNRPLLWFVRNVTSMEEMFMNCTNFNRPLNRWDVRNVTSMESMFSGCTKFNQPLNDWNLTYVTDLNGDINNMFIGCSITDENKPNLTRVITKPVVVVDPMQTHKAAAKINYSKLNDFLKSKIGDLENNVIDYPEFINEKIKGFITYVFHSPDDNTKIKELLDGLKQIMKERLNDLNYGYKSPNVKDSIFYSLIYVNTQSPEFQKMYVETFIQDCVNAYENNIMTCATGALERLLFSLLPACAVSENPDCDTISTIIESNPDKLFYIYIQDWYKKHSKNENKFPENTSENEKKESLKQFLMDKFRDQPEPEKWINKKLKEEEEGLDFEDNAFMYGGGRKTRRFRKKKKQRTRKKQRLKQLRKS